MRGAYGMWFRSGESLRFTKPGDETRFDTIMNVYERSRAAAAERDMRINVSKNSAPLDVFKFVHC
jgi:hypothetical protein